MQANLTKDIKWKLVSKDLLIFYLYYVFCISLSFLFSQFAIHFLSNYFTINGYDFRNMELFLENNPPKHDLDFKDFTKSSSLIVNAFYYIIFWRVFFSLPSKNIKRVIATAILIGFPLIIFEPIQWSINIAYALIIWKASDWVWKYKTRSE